MLAPPCYPKIPGRHIGVNGRPGGGVGAVADHHRRDEHAVAAHEGVLAYRGAVLVHAVVVGKDHPGPDVGPGADLRVAHVGQVRDLAAGADRGVLELDVAADVPVGLDPGARPQVGVRPDGDPGTKLDL